MSESPSIQEEREIRYKMISEIAHELRTPLGGILGINELLMTTPLSAEQKEFTQTVHESAKSLLTLLSDIVELARLENEKVVFAPSALNIEAVLAECAFALKKTLIAHKVELKVTVDERIPQLLRGDAVRLRQLLISIVMATLKYVEQGAIEIEAAHKQSHARMETVKFIISLPPQTALRDKNNVFAQVCAPPGEPVSRFDGTWVRLRIAKIILQMMEATIDVTANKLTFAVAFPAEKELSPDSNSSGL